MKKLLFATITFLSVSASAYSSITPIKGKEISSGIQISSRVLSADIPDCRHKGGNCTVLVTINGVERVFRVCCNEIHLIWE